MNRTVYMVIQYINKTGDEVISGKSVKFEGCLTANKLEELRFILCEYCGADPNNSVITFFRVCEDEEKSNVESK